MKVLSAYSLLCVARNCRKKGDDDLGLFSIQGNGSSEKRLFVTKFSISKQLFFCQKISINSSLRN